jgi:hypothetical protein
VEVSKSKLAFLVLLAVTVIYAVALYLSVQAYENWINEYRSRYSPEIWQIIEKYDGFQQYYLTREGMLLSTIGLVLLTLWCAVAWEILKKMFKTLKAFCWAFFTWTIK